MRRATTLALATGAALLARRALRRRIGASPLWPMPALEEPISGHGTRRSTVALKLTVTERTEPAEGVVRLRLEALDGAELPAWEPGAHLDLVLPSGLVRQYSLCGDPGRPHLLHRRHPAHRGRQGRLARGARAASGGGRARPCAGPATASRWWPPPRTCSSRAASGSRPSCP